MPAKASLQAVAAYWDATADAYQSQTRISTRDYHYGPLLPGDRELGLLPPQVVGARCLELGCGAAQNSLFLARQGAVCTALDVSAEQLRHARELAAREGVAVDLHQLGFEELPLVSLGEFDLVHSTWSLPFAEDPEQVVRDAARHLAPGGRLLLTTGHPLSAGDWVTDEEGLTGIFLSSYFDPPADVRHLGEDSEVFVRARFAPVSTVVGWVLRAGLVLERLVEPRPLPIPALDEEEIRCRAPYDSPAWREHYPRLAEVPIVIVLRAVKPGAPAA